MTEPTKTEGGQEQVNQELPTPKFTDASADSATSRVDTKALAAEVAKLLKPDFEKVAQSTKDKRIAALEKKLGVGDLAELEELGAQIPDSVKMEYRFRQLETQRQPESSGQTPTSQGSGANLTAQDVSEVVKNFQLDANSADVIEALRGTYRNRDHFEATLARLAMAKTNKPAPDAANSSTLNAQPVSTDKAAAIEKGYLEAIAKVPRGNTHQVSLVKAEWRKKAREAGLNLNV